MRRKRKSDESTVGASQRPHTKDQAHEPEEQTSRNQKDSVRYFAEGNLVFQEGQPAATGYQILSGAVLLIRSFERDTSQVLEAYGEGAIIGFSSSAAYDCSALAMTRTVARSIDHTELRKSIAIQNLLTEQMARSLANLRERTLLYGRKTAPRLVASALLTLPKCVTHRMFNESLDYVRDVRIMMSPAELASSLGLTAQTVRGVLINFEADEIVTICGRRLVVLRDSKRLHSIQSGEAFLAHPESYYQGRAINTRK